MSKRLLIAGTVVAASYCAYVLLPLGSIGAWVMAALCVGFPLAAWIEAARLRGRGANEAADVLVIWSFLAVLALSFMADFAVDDSPASNAKTPAQR